jgi:D-glycero-beta-D-manno-heptose-7-phosphate kinase
MTAQQEQLNVLVIGDVCIDRYIYTDNTRTNPEASALLLNYVNSCNNTGMAANVVRCLENLNIDVHFKCPGAYQWGTKTRYVDNKTKHILFRLDEEEKVDPFDCNLSHLNTYDAIVVSDYCKGFVTYDTLDWICKEYDGPIFLDTKKKDIAKYSRCFIKINEHEANAIYNLNLKLPPSAIITLGEKGVKWYNEHWQAYNTTLVDVCGAGDAFLAGIVYGFLNDEANMIEYGVVNAGLSVQHMGTYNPTEEELRVGMIDYDLQCGKC